MMKGLDDDVQSQRSTVVSEAVVILFKNLTKVFCWAAHCGQVHTLPLCSREGTQAREGVVYISFL
jgi:hypothetical protein